jgi:dienelactone hydrolase
LKTNLERPAMGISMHSFRTGGITGVAVAVSGIGGWGSALAATPPPFEQVKTYETTIPATDDPADIYYPVPSTEMAPHRFPLTLLLQGAFVDKADYTDFARAVASHGFVVVVPNRERSVFNPRTGQQVVGFAAEQRQVHDVLDFIAMQADAPDSPLAGLVDPERYGLIGHSLGGYVGLSAIRGSCLPLICSGESFQPPPELDAGVFYGTTFEAQPRTGSFMPIDNPIPLALIAGSEDGEANYERVVATYEQIQNPPRALIRIEGANHYGITNENSDRAVNPSLIEQSEAVATIAYWTAQFLRAHLWDDPEAFETVYGTDRSESVTIIVQPGETPAMF